MLSIMSELYEMKVLIAQLKSFEREKSECNSTEYICKHFDTYKEDIENIKAEEELTMFFLEKLFNEYISYPEHRFGCFDFTKRAKVYYDDVFSSKAIKISIPFIEKREYYCVINLLNNEDLLKWGSDYFI